MVIFMAIKVLLIESEEDVMIGAKEVFEIHGVSCDILSNINDIPTNTDVKIYDIIISSDIKHIGRYNHLRYIKKPYTAQELLNITEQPK